MPGEVETLDQSEPDHYADALRRFRGDVRMMEQVLATMIERGAPRSEVHLGLMLDEYLASRSLRKARAIVGQLDELGVRLDPRRRFEVALASAAAGSADEALATIDALMAEQRDPAPEQAARVLELLVGARRLPPAWSLYRRMRARGQAASREVHLTLLADCAARRAAKDTVTVVQGMVAAGHRVPSGRAAELVRSLAATGQVERALEVATLVTGAATDGAPGLDPETQGVLLRALARRGRVADVEDLARRLSPAEGSAPSHVRDAVVTARIAAGALDAAWADVEAMWADAVVPSGTNLEALMDAAVADGAVARATGLLDLLLLVGANIAPQRSGAVLRAEMAASGVDTVLPLAGTLLERELTFDRATARDLVERLVRARRLDDARAWLERFRRSRTLTQPRSYSSLLAALAAAKRLDDAVVLAEEMVAAGIAPEVADLTRLITARIRADDLARADRLLAVADRGRTALDEALVRELMWAHAKRGDPAGVERAIASLTAGGHPIDERHEKARAWASGATPRRLGETPEGILEGGTDGAGPAAAPAPEAPAPEAPTEPVAPAEPAERSGEQG